MCIYSYCTQCTVHGELTCGGGGNIRIYVYLQLLYTVHHTWCTHVWWWAIYAYMCTYSYCTRCTVHGELTCGGGGNIRIHVYLQLPYMVHLHGALYMVHRTRCTVHSAPYMVYSRVVGGGNICIHVYLQLPYTVNSRVVVGAIYAYMCTYSYCTWCTVHGAPYTVHCTRCTIHGALYTVHHTRCTHVWWWGQYMHTCVPTTTIHGELTCGGGGNIHIHVYLQLPYTVYRTWCTIHGELMCGGGIHVWELLTCAGDIHV